MNEEFILWHCNGGWFTKGSTIDSRVERAMLVDHATALDMVKLHDGKLLPVNRTVYLEAMKGKIK